ncbi:MAG TPA: hypothetical protein VK507_01885 [Iamia sp.]|nr:hypothetical protein [Iamia sp.]
MTADPERSVRTYAAIGPGPAWRPGVDVYGQDPGPIRRHLAHMEALFDEGTLLVGGPEEHGLSGFALFATGSVADAHARMAADPAVHAGIFTFTFHELRPYFDAFARNG